MLYSILDLKVSSYIILYHYLLFIKVWYRANVAMGKQFPIHYSSLVLLPLNIVMLVLVLLSLGIFARAKADCLVHNNLLPLPKITIEHDLTHKKG